MLRRMLIFVGRGRVGKTLGAEATLHEMRRRGHPVEAWDLDRAPWLAKFTDAMRPTDSSDPARRAGFEKAIHRTVNSDRHAIIDLGGDDVIPNMVQDKLPNITPLLLDAEVESVGVHLLGPQVKDLAYFEAVQDTNTFARQVVVLNYGLVPTDGPAPHVVFEPVRRIVEKFYAPNIIRAIPPEAIRVLLGRKAHETFLDVAENSDNGLDWTDRMAFAYWLSKSIAPLVDILVEDPSDALAAE